MVDSPCYPRLEDTPKILDTADNHPTGPRLQLQIVHNQPGFMDVESMEVGDAGSPEGMETPTATEVDEDQC